MNNKEVSKDKKEQAYEDLLNIIKLFKENTDQEYVYHCTKKILKNNNWI